MYKNELEVKQALGIESWRNLSKDKVIQFAALMPDMDTEVALKIIDQFPAFKEFAIDAVGALEKTHKRTIDANAHSQDQVHSAFQHVREILQGELDKPDLTFEEKQYFVEQIQRTADQESAKDSENKRFLDSILKKVFLGTGVAVLAAAAVLGAKATIESKDDGDRSRPA